MCPVEMTDQVSVPNHSNSDGKSHGVGFIGLSARQDRMFLSNSLAY